MITDQLLAFVNMLVTYSISVRPQWEMTIPDGVYNVFNFLRALDPYVPVSEFVACFTGLVLLVAALQGWKWTIKLLDWIADIIP